MTQELTLTNRRKAVVRKTFDAKVSTLIFNPHSDTVEVWTTDPNKERKHFLLAKGAIVTSWGHTTVQATAAPSTLRITTHAK